LCGPVHVPSTNGNKYIMSFIDDYTKMCGGYLLKDKSQYFETLKKIHVWIQNEAQSHIGTLCIYYGREYTSNEIEKYIFQHGIQHQTMAPCNPQQNGLFEIMNRTLLSMVCSMMFFKNVKLMFWDDVVLCVAYVKNKILSHALGNNTPCEICMVAFIW
jgi:transposase InsO family protein